ncbi:unnamed protein product [Brachionus calyciflorus]|uniref:CEP72 n=1 Tax=Brachionus calyciflorus TaxID=104777 RepID=A0A813M0P6_9BILA|nr:unnamed protein product [Brachionus calyciflorus]
MDSNSNAINEEWIRKKLNINHDNLDDIKTLSLPGTYQEKISHLGTSLFRFTRLKELDLSRNTLISLEGLENLKLLEKLNLYYNNIGSLKELERLKYNTALSELDLRLNPITKEENDYRLFLINILSSLRVLDDRGIRESERQMAASFLSQTSSNEQRQNGKQNLNNAIVARVNSVSNIARRSVGLTDDDDLELRQCSKNYEADNFDEYEPKQHREYENLYNKSQENDFINRTKSCSMMNLRSISNEVPNTQFHMNDESEYYSNFRSRANFTPNPHYEEQKDLAVRKNHKDSSSEQESQNLSEENKGQIYMLLDLVDRYWNGSKSLHKNVKFLSSAKQILGENQVSEKSDSNYYAQIKALQDENRRLNHQLNQKSSKNELESDSYKSLISEIENLKKKYLTCQEEKKNLMKELSEKSDKQKQKDDALNSMETQNSNMKRDIEIMKIKLKQYEQLQQLTSMLQESHKSLVSTNEHLLQEINVQKQFVKPSQNQSRLSYSNEMDVYNGGFQIQDSMMPQIFLGQDSKSIIRKQFEQISSGTANRFAYPTVK